MIYTKVFAEHVPYNIAFSAILNCHDKLQALRKQVGNPSLCDLWIRDVQAYLFDLAIDMNNSEEAELRSKLFKESPVTIRNLKYDLTSKQTLMALYSQQGRLSYIKNDLDKALEKLATFIDFDLSEWANKDEKFTYHYKSFQHMARDYLVVGKILIEKGFRNRALEIFKAGLELNPDHGNFCFQKKILAELHSYPDHMGTHEIISR